MSIGKEKPKKRKKPTKRKKQIKKPEKKPEKKPKKKPTKRKKQIKKPEKKPEKKNDYPTKNEILNSQPIHSPETEKLIKAWKNTDWIKNSENENDKKKSISRLIKLLSKQLTPKNICKIKYIKNEKLESIKGCYIPKEKTIIITSKISIITALHEFGHHLFGKSELKACLFSVHLFKKTFKTSYNKLKWVNHTLINKE